MSAQTHYANAGNEGGFFGLLESGCERDPLELLYTHVHVSMQISFGNLLLKYFEQLMNCRTNCEQTIQNGARGIGGGKSLSCPSLHGQFVWLFS